MDRVFDAIVIGGGPAGFASALALAAQGRQVAVVAGSRPPARDGRCIALMNGAIQTLGHMGVDEAIFEHRTRLAAIRIIDATGALLRAPTVTFRASEIGAERFGLAIPAFDLAIQLRKAAEQAGIVAIDTAAEEITADATVSTVKLADAGLLTANLVIGADGAKSIVRQSAHIRSRAWSYPQIALTFIVSHPRDHDDISTEFHTREGPFTLVPNGDHESSVVWLVAPERAAKLLALDDAAFALAAERQCSSILGAFTLKGARGQYPMRGALTPDPTGSRVALVGEAAHVFPPIGAQGLNLGLRDVKALAKAVKGAGDIGAPEVLKRYAEARRFDLASRTAAVDMLNRSLLSGLFPVQMMRGAGLALLNGIKPLRQAVMRLGVA